MHLSFLLNCPPADAANNFSLQHFASTCIVRLESPNSSCSVREAPSYNSRLLSFLGCTFTTETEGASYSRCRCTLHTARPGCQGCRQNTSPLPLFHRHEHTVQHEHPAASFRQNTEIIHTLRMYALGVYMHFSHLHSWILYVFACVHTTHCST